MKFIERAAACGIVAFVVAGCASQQTTTPATPASTATVPATPAAAPTAPTATPYGPTRIVKSRDGRFEGEMVGNAAAGSKFSKLAIGMTMNEVMASVGGPDGMTSNETGKRWIPFYFGNDARRIQVFYKGEGCLTYTGGNAWGGGGNELIRITATSKLTCME